MKTIFAVAAFLCFVTLACRHATAIQDLGVERLEKENAYQVELEPGKQLANSITVTNSDGSRREIKFWLYVPSNYAEVDELPCMMFLHGMGERGDDLALVKKWGPPKLIEEGAESPFILISPQCPKDIKWETNHLVQILDAVEGSTKVDKQRVYLTGLSMGGYGTWAMLAACPDRIAAAVPICGGGDPATAEKMTNVPIWAFHGDADTVVALERSQTMVDAVNKAGGNATFKIYEGVGHNSWSETYGNQEVYDWLMSHTRNEDEK
jgi:predicted peptidase